MQLQFVSLCLLGFWTVSTSQQVGTITLEESPQIGLQHCTKATGCQSEQASLVLDANWRWLHKVGGYSNCYDGRWSPDACPDIETCKKNCAMEGVTADGYVNTYGVQNITGGVSLKYVSTKGNVGSRLYVTDGDESYKTFMLLNREFAMDVDVSTLECGLNGAVYFIEMDSKGGKGKGSNEAGAKYGTGYCDAQCPQDKWDTNPNHGVCCVEMDVWEANSRAAAYTPHPCSTEGPTNCDGIDCGLNNDRFKGLCDKDGCDLNSYRMGDREFYGPGSFFTLDSTKPMTVVTQFLTDDGSDDGNLVEIRQFYIQDGKLISHSSSSIPGVEGDSVTDSLCTKQKSAFGSVDHFQVKGGLTSMGRALKRGMVLSLSLWDDYSTQMGWLDATFPPDANGLGVARGPCDGSSSNPDLLRRMHRDAYVKYTNIKYGEINSTFTSPESRRLDVHI
jgi:cellulose 1,4-beta-cellobiosidase